MTYYSRNRFDEPAEMSDEDLFALMAKALAPKPRLLLTKSIAGIKRKSIAPKKPALLIPSKILSDRELLGGLSDAVARGWLSGHDALAAEKLVQSGQPLPKAVRDAILGKRS